MSDISEQETNTLFPYFLISCIEQGIIDRQTAFKIDKIISNYNLYDPAFDGIALDPRLTFESMVLFSKNIFALELASMMAKGEAELKLVYARSFEDVPPEQTFAVTLTIE